PLTAFSYAWDSEEGTGAIVCDGALITVTNNCIAGLTNFRDDMIAGKNNANEGTDARIWVDAICINQAATAVEKKGHQIALMGGIYNKAASVRVWLGEQDIPSRLACEYFAKVSGIENSKYYREFRWSNRGSEHHPRRVGRDMARRWPQLSRNLADFFSRSWFTRAWPVQEVTLPDSDRVTVVCGDQHLKLDAIRVGLDVLRELHVLPGSANIDQAVALQFYLADAIALKRGRAPLESGKRFPDRSVSVFLHKCHKRHAS
ncbi:heterokaryon incompatibility protein-domain-containing protein, partial [Cladorrhinum sp. PSN332]